MLISIPMLIDTAGSMAVIGAPTESNLGAQIFKPTSDDTPFRHVTDLGPTLLFNS